MLLFFQQMSHIPVYFARDRIPDEAAQIDKTAQLLPHLQRTDQLFAAKRIEYEPSFLSGAKGEEGEAESFEDCHQKLSGFEPGREGKRDIRAIFPHQ
jgi:hypothetical protein